MNGLNYQGTWNANSMEPSVGSLSPGDYFLVSVANPPYVVGDWLVLNDNHTFERVTNSTAIVSVHGRIGAVVGVKGDYDLDKMSDVDLTGKTPGDVLRFDGTNWVAAPFTTASVTQVTASAPLSVTNTTTTPAISLPAATNSSDGYLKSSDWVIFNSKEPAVATPISPTTKYYRGDKTFVTLDTGVVPENGNLYFLNSRVLGTLLTGVDVTTAGSILPGDSILSAFGKTQRQLNSLSSGSGNYLSKNSADTLSGAISLTNTITASGAGDFVIAGSPATANSVVNKTYADSKVAKSGDTMTGDLTLDSDLKIKGGTHYVTVKGSATTAADYILTLPINAGAAGYVLSTDGAGVTSWIAPPTGGGGGSIGTVSGTAPVVVTNGSSAPVISMPAASGSVDGYLTSGNWTTFNSKEPAITAAATDPTKKFYRGDKTFTTIDSNVLATLLAGFDNTLMGAIADGDTILQAFGKTQQQINSLSSAGGDFLIKNNTDAITGVVTVGTTGSLLLTYTPTDARDAVSKTYADTKIAKSGDTITGVLTFDNDLKIKSGSHYTTLKGNASATADLDFILPIDAGSSGYVLSTNGSGVTSWITQSASPVTSVFGRAGVIVATAGDYTATQVTNTAAGGIAATTVQAAINELDTEKQNTASLGTSVRAILLDGLSLATSTAIAAGDSILSAFGKLQAQVSLKADLTNASQSISALAMSVTSPPSGDYGVANKAYVDAKAAALPYQGVTANYNVVLLDGGKLLGVSNGATVTLPDATAVPVGFQVYVKQLDSSAVTIATTNSQTIDGDINATFPSANSSYLLVNTGTGWLIASKYIAKNPALITRNPTSLTGLNATAPTDGVCQNVTVTNAGELATSVITTTASAGFSKTGCTDTCAGQVVNSSGTCVVGVRALGSNPDGAISGTLTIAATSGGSVTVSLSGTIITDACLGAPSPGTVCSGGAIYLGSLSPGATSGSGTNKYMTTPGGCGEIPAGQIVGSGASAYPNADFTPTCSGTDSLTKYWNDGSSNWAVVPGLTDYTSTTGVGNGAINTDLNYGSSNTTNIVAVTAGGSGGYHAAARYCDRLNYGGYTDWYLPNRYELNLMWTNRASVPGLDTASVWYWSSTEYSSTGPWIQRFDDGTQYANLKSSAYRFRCVRRF